MPTSVRHLKEAFKGSMPIVLFAQWPEDKLYYIVKILKLDEKKGKCLVKFEDGHECWANKADMHLQYHTSCYPYEDSDNIFCCLCDSYESERNNELILCDVCQQGFHQQCHQPKVRQVDIDNDGQEWQCSTCNYILNQLSPMAISSTPKARSKPKAKNKKDSPRSLAMKASEAKRQAAIKLTRDKKATKKPTQEASKGRPAPEPMSDEDQPEPDSMTESPEESPEKSPIREVTEPEPAPGQTDDHKEDEEPDAQFENLDTAKFVDAVVKKAVPAKGKSTTSKVPKKAAATKKASKIPAPA